MERINISRKYFIKIPPVLKSIFIELVSRYANDCVQAEKIWLEIEKAYTNNKRHYHTLVHLEKLIQELQPYRQTVKDWDTILFAVFYHDIVYSVLKNNNEEKSAAFAAKKLKLLNFPSAQIENCTAQILATKSHTANNSYDTDLFTDADLSILGELPAVYEAYCKQVRKEYAVYPHVIYKPGRKKVLQHFLQKEVLFKTQPFFNKYETQARINLLQEFQQLS